MPCCVNVSVMRFTNYEYHIIITKNIRYRLWNQGFWHPLNNTYLIFLTPCIQCTDHLCDSCGLIDVNPHFIPSVLPNDSKFWPIVTSLIQGLDVSNCDVTMTDCSRVVSMDIFLAQWCWGQWFIQFVKDTSVSSFSESVEPWNVWQVTSWLSGQGQCAKHEIMEGNVHGMK